MEAGAEPVLALVSEVMQRTGPGGSCQVVKVTVVSTGRSLTRIIEGPVRKGDHVYLLEAERDLKVSRR
ncbi:small subunit ribosomal protein S28e [Nematocida major]|uniref:small subunit ribosomal protein S28e n=1 Tax=Nematocida major TaxID=1912982 RepID=UPI002008E106|nr:small subunit ribosomal protein S28e [Nematocida major]KAH9387310.1 small subunit ribosomal protein S28e [Nematocida major]